MRKFVCSILILLAVGMAQAYVVEDFETYADGQVETVTTDWTAIPAAYGNFFIGADFRNPLNQVVAAVGQWGQARGGFWRLPIDAQIPEGATKTLFLRFRASNNTTDHSFGMTNVDTPTTWGDFRAQVAIVGGTIRARNGSATTQLSTISHGWNQPFYNVWVVINNSSDTYDVYMNQTQEDATAANRLTASSFVFRAATTEALDRFFILSNNNDQRLWFDDIHVMDGATLVNPLRFQAYNPSPAYKTTGVNPFDLTLTWNTAVDPANPANVNPAIAGHRVYYTNEPNELAMTMSPAIAAAGATGSYTLTLNEDSTYYWRVEEVLTGKQPGDANNLMGPIWVFETQKSVPVISAQPATQRVAEGSASAAFSVQFASMAPAQVTWKRIIGGVESTISSGVTTTNEGAAYTSTVTLANPQVADEGMYYCQINNGTAPVDSAQAALIINRRVAHYAFENNLADSEGGASGIGKNNADLVDPNNPSNPPSFVPVTDSPRAGFAISLDGAGQYVDFTAAGYPKAGPITNGLGGGLDAGSIQCWVRVSAFGGILSNYNDGALTGFSLSVSSALNARVNVRGEGPAGEYQELGTAEGKPATAGFNMADGNWHFVTSTWNGNTVRVYVDGGQVATASNTIPARFLDWQRGVLLGATRSTIRSVLSTTFFGGQVDELQVFNYAKTAEEIAQEYYDESAVRTCLYPAFEGSNFNADNTGSSYCKINLADFAMFAQTWLAEGLYP